MATRPYTQASPEALAALSRRWQQSLDGGRLKLKASASTTAMLRQMVAVCLHPILSNAAELATNGGQPEQLHQLRTGIRRLRSALKLFGDWGAQPHWEDALAQYSVVLGQRRDRDVLEAELLPELRALAGPSLPICPPRLPAKEPARDCLGLALRSPHFSELMLELMAFSQSQDEQPSTSPHLDRLLRSRLRKLEKRLRRRASELMSIDDTARHRLRKRLKRLRDGLELAHALLAKSKSRRRLRSIAPLQIALGRYNDMCQALTQFETMTPTAGRWFAKGWAMTRKQDLLKEAQQALCRWLAT